MATTPDEPDSPVPPPELPVPGAPEPEMDPAAPAPEVGGRGGPEPVRYGDWERRGVAVDF